MGAVDDGFVTEIGLTKDDEVDLLSRPEVGWHEVHVPGEAGGGDNAAALFIDVDMDHVMISHLHADFLLAEWNQQVLW